MKAIALAALLLVSPAQAEADTVDWKLCADIAAGWDTADRASECMMIKVPVDYGKPNGRQIDIAVSRIKATEPAKRKGVLLLNPGGPGIPGITEPVLHAGTYLKEINRYYDLIGFDTRGVGYSGKTFCPEMDASKFPPTPPGVTGKAAVQFRSDAYAKNVSACAAKDPELSRSLTAANAARDMDRIRVALGEQKISYQAISWGSALGSAYRSMFDNRVDRMLLESLMAPGQNNEDDDDQVAAKERLFNLFTKWIAGRDQVYHFGKTAEEVRSALLALPNVNSLLRANRARWAESAKALADIRDGVPVPQAAPKPEFPGNGWSNVEQYGDAEFVIVSFACNDSSANRDFETEWQRAEQLKVRYPVAGFYGAGVVRCQGWPFPANPTKLTKGRSALQLVGHEFETNTVIKWAHQMQDTIGGPLLRVQDDVHSSLSELPCWEKANDFLINGRTSTGTCPGAPIPNN
ncbi:alpha/beta hydrolase [Kibdelosporangium philippinense]|uniref:Alpha/beta hydrolase n=1 Tax=Kibdelosporangium philippinense TaxID=211113 RepID=A0ABS8ZFS4_9PSEU|nr:alpha/beta fold hydrolase [Kibdelosporangium philippinense]MCE7005373.1 alpha/beta hydrolase [Kibdelosporangium philippinense]